MQVAILSNINIDSIARRLKKQCQVYIAEGYGNWIREIIDESSNLYACKPENIFIIIDGEEIVKGSDGDIYEYFSYIEQGVKNNPDIKFFISNIDIPKKKINSYKSYGLEFSIENIWHNNLTNIIGKYQNAYVFDIKSLICNIGRENFYSRKMWYLGGIKFSSNGEKAICREIIQIVQSQGIRKKCLILDLDNTLWGNVVGEDGVDGICLSEYKEGARYKDFQSRIKEIKELGVILTIVSKNNKEDAIEVLRKHPNMVLREEDFTLMKINWKSKVQNIKELSKELNLGLSSFVFIDDNPVERENVKIMLPEITVPDFPEDTSELESFITEIYNKHFLRLTYSKEDEEKTVMYQQNIMRDEAKKQAPSVDEFLKSLEIELSIWKAKEEDVVRVSELTQKTNQFNLTTKRYSEKDIINMINSEEYDVYVVSAKDKFGDNGKISVIIIKKDASKKEAILDTFLLSCRVMGRNIEDMIMKYIEEKLLEENYTILYSEYIPTPKNKPVENLFDRYGYKIIEICNSGYRRYYSQLEKEKKFKCYGKYI